MTNGIFLRLQLLAVVLTGLVSTKCFGVFCVNTTVEEEQQVYHPFFQSDFSFFGPIPNDSKPPKINECGVSKYFQRRKPRHGERQSSVFRYEPPSKLLQAPPPQFHTMRGSSRVNLPMGKQKARIINGVKSRPGAWPWQVSLQLLHPKMGFIGHWCGGVLLNGLNDDLWVLTAAHCISNDAFNYPFGALWTVVAGEHDRSIEEGFEQRLLVEKVIVHERFKEYHHDIALMKLQKTVGNKTYTDRVRAICLPSDDDPDAFKGVKCIATGWGLSKKGGKLENTLHQTELLVVENSFCKQVYGTMYNIPINGYHVCAGPIKEGESGTCVGDSGGPLQCNLRDGRWYLAGLTSFGSGCAIPGFPDVFTRITYYLPWIRGKIFTNESVNPLKNKTS